MSKNTAYEVSIKGLTLFTLYEDDFLNTGVFPEKFDNFCKLLNMTDEQIDVFKNTMNAIKSLHNACKR